MTKWEIPADNADLLCKFCRKVLQIEVPYISVHEPTGANVQDGIKGNYCGERCVVNMHVMLRKRGIEVNG